MAVDTGIGLAIFTVVGFVLKYIYSATVSCNFCAVRPESSSYPGLLSSVILLNSVSDQKKSLKNKTNRKYL